MYGYVFIASEKCGEVPRQGARRWFPTGRSLKWWNGATGTVVEMFNEF